MTYGAGTCARSSRTCRSRAASAFGGDVAATVAGAVVDAHSRRAGDLWRDPSCDRRRGLAEPGLEHDGRASRADAADVQPMAADVDEPVAGDRCGGRRRRVCSVS